MQIMHQRGHEGISGTDRVTDQHCSCWNLHPRRGGREDRVIRSAGERDQVYPETKNSIDLSLSTLTGIEPIRVDITELDDINL